MRPGVERIADEVAALFPDARTAIVTSDTIWSPPRAAEFVDAMEADDIDIVIGTQLVTKGYHFPNLTLVGVVDADLGLAGGDLRAAERSFQQIQQVAGRAGRGDKPGRVFVQTHEPDAPVIAALVTGDAAGFYAAETEARREAAMPPFGRLAAIVISAEDAAEPRRRPPIGHAAPKSKAWRSSAPPPPRSPCCAAATATACWSTPAAPRRPGRDPRLARRSRLARQGPRQRRCRPL